MKKYFPDMPLVAYPNTGEKWQRSNKIINTDKIVQNSKSEKGSSNMLFFNFFLLINCIFLIKIVVSS